MALTDITALFNEIITEHGSSAIQKERIVLLKEKMEALVDKVKELEAKNAQLEKERSSLAAQLKAKTRAEEFVEHRGAFFKRKPEGGYHLAVYCPICRHPADSPEGVLPYCCDRDNWFAGAGNQPQLGLITLPYCCDRDNWFAEFDRRALENIMKELPL